MKSITALFLFTTIIFLGRIGAQDAQIKKDTSSWLGNGVHPSESYVFIEADGMLLSELLFFGLGYGQYHGYATLTAGY